MSILIADVLFGDSNYNPTGWLSHVWFAEVVAFIATGAVVAMFWKRFRVHMPWIFAGLGALFIAGYVVVTNIATGYQQADQYNNPIGKVYQPIESTIPYNTPFNQAMKDYSLESSVPEFIKTQVFVLVPFAAGYASARFSHREKKTQLSTDPSQL